MSILARARIVNGKMKLLAADEHDRHNRDLLVKFAQDTEGKDFFLEVHDFEELSFDKNISNYYRKIVLPALFIKMRTEYNLESIGQTDALLSDFYLKTDKAKEDKTAYVLVPRLEDLSFVDQARFLSKCANLAISKYDIRFPSATEIQNNLVK